MISSPKPDDTCWFVEGTPRPGFILCPMTNMAPLGCADVAGWLLTRRLPKRGTCGQRAKIFSSPFGWYVILWVYDFLGVAFSPSIVQGADSSVTPQAKLVLVVYRKECLHASPRRETSVSVHASYPYSSFEAVKCF